MWALRVGTSAVLRPHRFGVECGCARLEVSTHIVGYIRAGCCISSAGTICRIDVAFFYAVIVSSTCSHSAHL